MTDPLTRDEIAHLEGHIIDLDLTGRKSLACTLRKALDLAKGPQVLHGLRGFMGHAHLDLPALHSEAPVVEGHLRHDHYLDEIVLAGEDLEALVGRHLQLHLR